MQKMTKDEIWNSLLQGLHRNYESLTRMEVDI